MLAEEYDEPPGVDPADLTRRRADRLVGQRQRIVDVALPDEPERRGAPSPDVGGGGEVELRRP
nr:hypothetical protein [Virgisporangium ochraceum]